MSKEYHISLNGKNLGIFSLSQIQENKIDPEALVWFDGQDDWKSVHEIEELKVFIKVLPPPLPKDEGKKIIYAPGYLIMGIICIAIAFLFSVSVKLPTQIIASISSLPMDIEPYNTITNIILIGFRLFVTLLVVDTMKFYNRSTFGWGLLSFILPAVAMISAAFVKPLKKNKNKKVSK